MTISNQTPMQFSATSDQFILTALAQHNGMFVLSVDRDARITKVIGKSSHAVRYHAEAAIGQPIDRYFSKDPNLAKLFHDALRNQPQKVTFHSKNDHYFETQIIPLFDDHKNVCGALSFEIDVTEREKLAFAHREQEEKLERLFQETEDGIYLLDTNFVIQRANVSATALHQTEGPLVGQVCYQRIFGRDQPCEFCPAAQTFHTGQSAENTYYDEKFQMYLQLRSAPLFDPQTGKLVGAFETFRNVSDSHQLEQTEKQMQVIISKGNVPIAFATADGKITFANTAFHELIGYPISELLGTYLEDYFCDEQPQTDSRFLKARAALYAKVMDQYRQDVIIVRKNGETRWVDLTASTIRNAEGKKTHVIYILLDITAHYQIFQAFTEAHELAQIILDTAPIECVLFDTDGTLFECNVNAAALLGLESKQEYINRFLEFVPEYQPDGQRSSVKFAEAHKAVLKTGSARLEWTYRKPDGTLIPCDVRASRVMWKGKEVVVCYGQDLREHRKILAEVSAAEERSQIMLDTNPLSCILFEVNRQPIDCSLQALTLFGVKDKKELSDRFYELAPEFQPDGRRSDELMHEVGIQALETGYCRCEIVHQTLDGTPFPCEITLVPIKHQGRNVLASYARDLREHKEMLAKMRETDERSQIMLDANPLACQLWDANFKTIDCNMAAVSMFGFKDKQEYCNRFLELLPEYQPDGQLSIEMAIGRLKAALETGYQRFEPMQQLPDGTPFPCEVTLVRIPQGKSFIICGYTRDLREQKEMLAKIHEANAHSQLMLDATPIACTLIAGNGKPFDCNLATVRMFEVNNKQDYCERLFEFIPTYQPNGQLSTEMRGEKIEQAFQTGYQRYEWMGKKPDGTPLPCEVTFVRVQYEGNYILAAYVRDLREYKEMLAQIHEANELTKIMLDATPLGSSIWDEELRTIDCNQEVVNMFGLSSKQEFQDRFFELCPKYQPNGQLSGEVVRERIRKTFETGYQRFEFFQQLLDSTPVPCEVTLVRVPKGNEHIVCGYLRDLREYKEMLSRVHKANEHSQMMLDATPMACILVDKAGKPFDCNLAAVKMFGFQTTQEYLDRSGELFPEYQPNGQLSVEMRREKHEKSLKTGWQRYEWQCQLPNGTPMPCEVTIVRIPYNNDYILAGYIRDLREHTEMLAKLRQAHEHTQILLDATPLGAVFFDAHLNLTDCNFEAIRLFGLLDKQELRNHFFELAPKCQPNRQHSTEMAMEKLVTTLKSGYERFEYVYQKRDGTPLTCEVTLVRVPQGTGYSVAGYIRDIRAIKKHEAEQERDRLRMNALLELAQMVQQSEREIIDYTIKSAVSLTESVIGYVILMDHLETSEPIYSLHIDPSISCQVGSIKEKGIPHILSSILTECISMKKAVIHNDLSSLSRLQMFPEGHYPVSSHMNAPIMDGEAPIGIIGVGNKTEPYTEMDAQQLTLFAQGLGTWLNRRKYAEHLEKAKIEAENANRAKSDFLAHMSHEIRTPMNAVLGMAELALREEIPPAAYEQIATIKQSGQTLLSIINDILDFSKIESGKLEIIQTDYLLTSLINDVVSIIQMRMTDSRVRLAVNIASSLPSMLSGDEIRIRQILLNILGNAVKYTEEGYVMFNITWETNDIDANSINLLIEVADSGKGIKKEDLENLFGNFVRLDLERNRHIEGTGLGLAIVQGLVATMNGKISVKSEYGIGSTFNVTLPQKVRVHERIATVEKPEEKRVLVYERRKIYGNSIIRSLNDLGVECTYIESDSEFSQKLSQESWSFVFIADALYKRNAKLCSKYESQIHFVLIVGFGESITNPAFNILPLPAHSISIANILNGGQGGFKAGETSNIISMVRFTAPDAVVLVVDDINTNLSVMEGLLLPYQMNVHLCRSGKEAIEAVNEVKYDLVFMDHMMPEMDGVEATARIRALGTKDPYYANVPIIALTANAISGTRKMFLESGFSDFLSKPIDTSSLDALLAKWIVKDKRKRLTTDYDSGIDSGIQKLSGSSLTPDSPIFSIANLNVQKGFASSRGNMEVYKRTLNVFLQDGLTKIAQIKTALKTDHLPLYVTYVHGIKSAAAYIGADEVSELARALEMAGNQEDLTYIQTHNPKFLSTLATLLKEIGDALKLETAHERMENADRTLLNAELAKLEEAIVNINPRAIKEAVKSLQPLVQTADVGEAVEEILHNVSIGEYDEVVFLIKSLLSNEMPGLIV